MMFFILLFGSLLGAQNSTSRAGATAEANQQSQDPAQASGPQSGNDLAQMQADLDKMESLNMNMSTEIEFLRDQNLQILLRTNSQMWTLLIRDLKRQLRQEEERRAAPPPSGRK